MNLNFLKSAFDKIGAQSDQLKQIAAASQTTAAAITAGGVLYTKVDEMVLLLRQIAKNGITSKKDALKDAKVLGLVGKAMEPIGLGFDLIVEALNKAPNAEELDKKIKAIVGGLVQLTDVGKSILKFAGFMALSAPLLMLAAIASPFVLVTLFFITKGISLVNKAVDGESLEKFKILGDIGKSILIFGGSLALFSLIGPLVIKGALFAGATLVLIGLTFKVLDKLKLDGKEMENKAHALKELGLGLLALTGSFAVIGLFPGLILKGAIVASAAILAIGGVFFILDKLKIIDKIENGAKSLSIAALSILAIGVSFALFDLIAPKVETILDIAKIVGGVAVVFAIAGIFGKVILDGAKAMAFAGLSILVLGLSLNLFEKLLPGEILSAETFKAFVVIGAIGLGFFLAGNVAPTILLGAAAMAASGIALILIGAGVFLLHKSLPKENAWEKIAQMGAVIAGVGLAMAGIGFVAPFVLAGAATLLVAGVAMIVLAGGIAVLSSLNMDKLFSRNGLFADSGQKTKGFLGIGGGRPKTNLEVMIDSIADSFAINPFKSAAILAGASTLLLAGAALLTVGLGISKFQKISEKADLPTLETNINSIVNSLAGTFGAIGNDPKLGKGGKKGLLSKVFGGGSQSPVADGISSVMGMGEALVNIAMGVQAMADLKFPTKYNKEGKAIAFESINISEKIKKLTENVKIILLGEDGAGGLVGTFASVGAKNGPDRGWFKSSNYEKGVKMIQNIGLPLINLAKGVQAMADLKFPIYDKDGNITGYNTIDNVEDLNKKVGDNTKNLILALTGALTEIGGDDSNSTSSWWQGSTKFEKGIKIVSMIGEPYEKLGKSVKDIIEIVGKLDSSSFSNKISDIIGVFTSSSIGTDIRLIESRARLTRIIGDSFSKMGKSIPNLVKSIKSIDMEASKKFNNLFIGKIDDKAPIDSYNAQSKTWSIIGESMPSISKSVEITSKAINAMNLEKLTEARTMFEALAALTHGGDANDILSKMGDSIEKAIEKLADMLNNFKQTVEEGNTGQQNILSTVGSAIDSLKESIMPNAASGEPTPTTIENNFDTSSVVRAIESLEEVLVQQGVKVRTL